MRGRSRVFVALVGFVLVATGVIWRRSLGSVRAREQQQLEHQREALEAERARLEGDIREASSLARLAPVVEARLNMHLPASDSQVILLQRPARRRGKE